METIDLVVTYVDSDDKTWQELYAQYVPQNADNQVSGKQRFRKSDNFKYWFRGVQKYVPWINNLFLVVQSQSQVPVWVNTDKVKVILHEDFIPKEYLPVFNSQAIEMFLWNIPGLSERFLYSNDDVYFTGSMTQDHFFDGSKVKTSFTFGRIEDSSNTLPLWKLAILNSFMLADKKEAIILFQQHKYISPTHTIRPYFKSVMQEFYTTNESAILNSISKFREQQNLTVYVYDFYQRHKGLTMPKNYIASYYSSKASVGLVANSLVNPDTHKIVCINDTDEEVDTSREKMLSQQFNLKFPNKCKYEK